MRLVLILLAGICAAAAESWEPALRLPADRDRLRDAPLYRIDAQLDEAGLDGSLSLDVRNEDTEPLVDLAFQTYANGSAFHGAAMTVSAATVAGLAVDTQVVAGGQGLVVALPHALAPGATTAVHLRWRLALSTAGGNHGLLARQSDGACVLHAWYPELARRREGGWDLRGVPNMGDPARARAHHVVADVTLPLGEPVIAGGTLIGRQPAGDGRERCAIIAAGVRNLTLVVGGRRKCSESTLGDIRIRSWWSAEHATSGALAAERARSALALYGSRFGPYPWPTLEVVEADLGDSVGGVESCGLVLVATPCYAAVERDPDDSLYLDLVVAHEVGHQWWQGMIGNDAVSEPWLDESLTSWSTLWWMQRMRSADAGELTLRLTLAQSDPQQVGGFQPLDRDINDFPDDHAIGRDIYARGTLAWEALRRDIGDRRLLHLLGIWAERGRFRPVDASQLRALMAEQVDAATSDRFWRRWVRGEGLTAHEMQSVGRPWPLPDPQAKPGVVSTPP